MADVVDFETTSFISGVAAGLIGFIVLFAINSSVSETNLWPMLGNLLTMVCVKDAGDGESDNDDGSLRTDAPAFPLVEKLPLDVRAESRADSVDTYGV